ncbi:MAG: hypothetical protein ACR2O3_05625 [Rhizobiaceae bacterium]
MFRTVINDTSWPDNQAHIEFIEMEGKKMTFPHDQIRDDIQAEEHSAASIAIVAVAMIIASSISLFMAI